MICIFFGHRDTPNSVKGQVKETVIELINKGVNDFYVGNNGSFDWMVQSIFNEIIKDYCNIKFTIVLSRRDEKAISSNQLYTLFPDGIENVPPRFAISKRNNWMLKRGDIVVAYFRHQFSNSYKLIEKAKKKGLKVINLAELSK